MKYLTFIYILYIFFTTNLNCQEASQFEVSAGVSLSTNVYLSNFNTLPNFNQCSANYRSALGFAPDYFIEAIHINQFELLGKKNSFAFKLSYSDISANYFIEDFVGYYIRDNDFERTITEHQLKNDIKIFFIEPALMVSPLSDYPISLRMGLHIGFAVKNDFTYQEILKSPEEANFIDGTKIRNSVDAELPDFSQIIYGLNLGASYNIWPFGNWSVKTLVEVRYGLKNLVNSLNWKYLNLSAGIAINYSIPKPPPSPPISPPYPPLIEPTPPSTKVLETELIVEHNGKPLEWADMVDMNFNIKKIINNYKIAPIIFYQQDQIEPTFIDNTQLCELEKVQANALDYLLKQIKSWNDEKIKIMSFIPEDEDINQAQARIDAILKIFRMNTINIERINTEIKVVSLNNIPNTSMRDEFRKIEFQFENGAKFFEYLSAYEIIDIEDLNFKISPNISTNFDVYGANGAITFGVDDFLLSTFKPEPEQPTQFMFKPSKIRDLRNPNISHYLTFRLTATAKDIEKTFKSDTAIRIYLGKKVKSETAHTNPIEFRNEKFEQHIIAYFEFDKSDYYYIDKGIVDYIKRSIESGKKIEIIPLTDNIGTTEYNIQLARSRAITIIKSLELNSEHYHIKLQGEPVFSNDYPWSRMLNRTVLVRIPVD